MNENIDSSTKIERYQLLNFLYAKVFKESSEKLLAYRPRVEMEMRPWTGMSHLG